MFKISIFFMLIVKLNSQCEFCDVLSAFSDPDFNENTMSKTMYTGIMEFKEAMKRNGYTEEACIRELKLNHVMGLDAQYLYRTIPFHSNPTPLQTLMYLFLSWNIQVGSGVPIARVKFLLGTKAVDALVELGILVQIDDNYHSTVLLTPFDTLPSNSKPSDGYDGLFIATDFRPATSPDWRELFESVMALGIDTKGLAYGAPRTRRARRLLDLCTGSGVQAILAIHYYADDVTLVDLNPRAVRFARFNLLLNGVSTKQSRVYQGDLYNALNTEEEKFDVILANPPYLAAELDTDALYGAGGRYGDRITKKVVQGARQWLTPNGVVRIVATTYNNNNYEANLKHWWGQGDAEISFYNAEVWDKQRILTMHRKWGHLENGSNSFIWIQRRPNMEHATFRQSKLHNFMWHTLMWRSGHKELIQYLLAVEDTSKLLPDYSIFINEKGLYHHVFKEVWLECGAQFNPPLYHPKEFMPFPQLPADELKQLLDCVFNHNKLYEGYTMDEACLAAV